MLVILAQELCRLVPARSFCSDLYSIHLSCMPCPWHTPHWAPDITCHIRTTCHKVCDSLANSLSVCQTVCQPVRLSAWQIAVMKHWKSCHLSYEKRENIIQNIIQSESLRISLYHSTWHSSKCKNLFKQGI